MNAQPLGERPHPAMHSDSPTAVIAEAREPDPCYFALPHNHFQLHARVQIKKRRLFRGGESEAKNIDRVDTIMP